MFQHLLLVVFQFWQAIWHHSTNILLLLLLSFTFNFILSLAFSAWDFYFLLIPAKRSAMGLGSTGYPAAPVDPIVNPASTALANVARSASRGKQTQTAPVTLSNTWLRKPSSGHPVCSPLTSWAAHADSEPVSEAGAKPLKLLMQAFCFYPFYPIVFSSVWC